MIMLELGCYFDHKIVIYTKETSMVLNMENKFRPKGDSCECGHYNIFHVSYQLNGDTYGLPDVLDQTKQIIGI